MDAYLAGWNGPLLVPSTERLTYAYRAYGMSGFHLAEMKALFPKYSVAHVSYRTRDDYLYFWGLRLSVASNIEATLLFPWIGDDRVVTMHTKGEIITSCIEHIIEILTNYFVTLTSVAMPLPTTVNIRLRQ